MVVDKGGGKGDVKMIEGDAKVCGLRKGQNDVSIGKTEGRVKFRMNWICMFWILRDSKSLIDIEGFVNDFLKRFFDADYF